jgi:hypothetical protein
VLASKLRPGHLVNGGESEGTLPPTGIVHFLFSLPNARPKGVRSLRLHQSSSAVGRSSSPDQSLSIAPCHRLRRNLLRRALSRPIVTSARSSEVETRYSLPQTLPAAQLLSRVLLLNDVGARGRLSACVVPSSVWKLILNGPLFLLRCFGFPFGRLRLRKPRASESLERAEKEHLLPIIGLLCSGLYG